MKFRILLVLFSVLTVSYFANSEESTKDELKDVKQSVKEYTAAEKKRIQERYRLEVEQLDRDIAKLKEKVKTTSESAKVSLNGTIADLENARAAVNEKIDRLADATGPAVQDLRRGVEKAMEDLKASFRKASDNFKKEQP